MAAASFVPQAAAVSVGDGFTLKCSSCLVKFEAMADLKDHHKSAWHRYNLKRGLSSLPSVSYDVFQQKLERLAKESVDLKGSAHLKHRGLQQGTGQHGAGRAPAASGRDAGTTMNDRDAAEVPANSTDDDQVPPSSIDHPLDRAVLPAELRYPGPLHSLFDRHSSSTIDENIEYMRSNFSFYIPNVSYLEDKEGLLRFLGDKLWIGRQCIYCDRNFASLIAVRNHMLDLGHTRIGTHTEGLLVDLEPFYDFTQSYKELHRRLKKKLAADTPAIKAGVSHGEDGSSNGEEWADTSDGGDEIEIGSDEDVTDVLLRLGIPTAKLTDTGNLKLPDGREAAHRQIAYVYRQHLRDPKELKKFSALAASRQLPELTEGEKAERSAQVKVTKRDNAIIEKKYAEKTLKLGLNNNILNRPHYKESKLKGG